MEVIISIILISYLILILILWLSWEKSTPLLPKEDFTPKVSIIIAIRNEEKNLEALFNDLTNQNYPSDQFEVIIVNDHSNDNSVAIVNEFIDNPDIKVKLLSLSAKEGKKEAIKLGYATATGEIILTTDGDCRLSPDWLATMILPFAYENINLVSGPVNLAPTTSFFERIQAIEYSSLIASGAATINLGWPTMANAANLAILKEVLDNVEEVSGKNRSSGDDVFLLHQVARKYPDSIYFCKDEKAIVSTAALQTLSGFFNQRKRWAGKWSSYKNYSTILLAAYIFLVNLVTCMLPLLAFYELISWLLVFNLIIAKLIFEYFFLRQVQNFFNNRILLFEFIILAMIYPFYVVFTALLGSITQYSWKNRRTR